VGRILLRNCLAIATADPEGRVLRNADLLIEGARIARIGRELPVEPDMDVVDGRNRVVLPGLVNTHHHLYQTLTRAVPTVQNAKLFDWLVGLYEIWRGIDAEAAYVSAVIGLAELALTGCTASADHFYLFPNRQPDTIWDSTLRAAREVGVRFAPTRGSMSRGRSKGGLPPDDVVQDEAAILKDYDRVLGAWHDPTPESRCRVGLAPCSPFSVSEDLMLETARYARRHGLRLHTHLAETLDEEAFCLKEYGARPLALMERLEWVGPDVWFAHGVHFNDAELGVLARTGTGVAHCPVSNLRLGSGIARVPAMLERGVNVGLAVDGSASNDASNLLRELQVALLVHRVGTAVDAMPPARVLEMATVNGARMLGFAEAGVLAEGRLADVAFWRVDDVAYAGALSDPLGALLLCGRNQTVDGSIVNGQWVVRDGRLLTVDLPRFTARANEISNDLLRRAGVRVESGTGS
jgi:cytosine/adenosine deaminase-related metal-dependent hydrolase